MRKLSNLKALLLPFMLVACFVLPMKAQKSDGFFRINNEDIYNDRGDGIGLGGATQENPTPVGSGLLILTIAGAGYAIVRRKSCKSYNSSVTLFLAFTLLLGLTQCKKNEIAPSVDNGVYITLDAGYGNAKTGFTPSTGAFVWSNGVTEYIYVGGSEHADCLGVLSGTGTGTGSMTFSGSLTTTPNDKETLHFFYLGKGRDGSAVSTLDFSNQDGTLENVTNYHIAVGDGSYTSGNINYATTLDMTMAIAYFNVSGYQNASETAETVYLHGEDVYTTATVDYQTGTIAGATKGYLNMGAATASKYVALIPSVTTETTLKFDSNSKTGTMTFLRGIQAGKYYANSDAALTVAAETLLEGTTPGLFSVSATKKVRFSQGNVQYIGSATTPYWRFAANQWVFLASSEGLFNGATNVDRDIFGGGTGDNPNNTSTQEGGYPNFVDWGTNAIANGGNEPNIWRTFTNSEMGYMFSTRDNTGTTLKGTDKKDARWTQGTINTDNGSGGINGIILFPDNYTAGTPEGVSWGAINTNSVYGTQCTTSGWLKLESVGCVFLPAAGTRGEYGFQDGNNKGYYWSGTFTTDYREYALEFYENNVKIGFNRQRRGFSSVRLIRDL